jgi:hypothetical protein
MVAGERWRIESANSAFERIFVGVSKNAPVVELEALATIIAQPNVHPAWVSCFATGACSNALHYNRRA